MPIFPYLLRYTLYFLRIFLLLGELVDGMTAGSAKYIPLTSFPQRLQNIISPLLKMFLKNKKNNPEICLIIILIFKL